MILRFSLILFSLVLISITGCKKNGKKNKIRSNDTLYSSQRYSEYVIDSAFVKKELKQDKTLLPYADDILIFYTRRNYQAAWLDHDTLSLAAQDFLTTLSLYQSEFRDSTLGAELADRAISDMLTSAAPDWRSMQDLKLTATFFKYAQRAYSGTSADPKDLEWFIPRMKKDYQRLLDSLVSAPASYSIYEPVNSYYRSLKKALRTYRYIEKNGGWPTIPVLTVPMHRGDSSADVSLLKISLGITGDYTDSDRTGLFSDALEAGIARYQRRMGLTATGVVDSLTLTEMNVPVSSRIRQIMLNMERLRWLPDSLPSSYLLVNIPEYRLHAYEDSAIVWSMDVVVGNAASRTSIFTGLLSVVDFCPYWNVPQSIVRNELLPKLKRNASYLSTLNMEVLSNGTIIDGSLINWGKYTTGVPFLIRQRPGRQNSLGLMAFFFPNSFDIFLHDTPAKSFFNESSRAFSHGCIRLSNAEKLADYIFRKDSTMPPERISQIVDRRQERKVAVRPNIPVYIVYFTAWVDPAGSICFRHDIYGHDAKLAKEIFAK